MQIAVERHTPWTVLSLDGVLDVEASPGVYLSFQRYLLRGETHFLFDLGEVSRVDTSGLGVLVRCYKDARSRGGEVGLHSVPDRIGRVLEFTRLDAIFRMSRGEFPEVLGPDKDAA